MARSSHQRERGRELAAGSRREQRRRGGIARLLRRTTRSRRRSRGSSVAFRAKRHSRRDGSLTLVATLFATARYWKAMATQNVETLRQAYEALGRGDVEGILGVCDSQIECQLPEGGIDAGTLRGRKSLRTLLEGLSRRLR